jgi:PleD family two-component response regulator
MSDDEKREGTILVVDDDRLTVSVVSAMCQESGYRTLEAYDGVEALRLALEEKPDLVLLDIMIPGKDGFEVCLELRSREDTADLPILMLTALQDIESMATGLEVGATDYIIKPVRLFELRHRMAIALESRKRMTKDRETKDVFPERDEPGRPGKIDDLFRLKYALEHEFSRAQRYGNPLSCVSLKLNDYDSTLQKSKRTAAEMIAATSVVLKRYLRSIDRMYRFAEHEFILLLPETPKSGAMVAVERIRKALRNPSHEDIDTITVTAILISMPDHKVGSAQNILDQFRKIYSEKGEGKRDCLLEP